jgi:hypothetical protein
LIVQLLIVIMFVVIIDVVIKSAAKNAVKLPPQDACPPHQWSETTAKDEAGTVVAWVLVCKKCGFRGGE